ncbi:hypothetical protein [Streptomyces sp. GbtcB7]|uniref:hypothetical protein n=1 Tax=Streptomyces sp. GbtcB7 TaxID=2824752 RepID=UPI001C30835A|nr:hypothetical protein [Streptomyces sp. GbtcB7]
MDRDADRRLRAITPDISQVTIDRLRKVVGLEPAERVPAEALRVADRLLEGYGTGGRRVLLIA